MARPAAACPLTWDVDNPATTGPVQNQDAYMQAVAAQRPYFFDHIEAITDQVMDEYYALTGRRYQRATGMSCDDADYLIIGQGSMVDPGRGGRRLSARRPASSRSGWST